MSNPNGGKKICYVVTNHKKIKWKKVISLESRAFQRSPPPFSFTNTAHCMEKRPLYGKPSSAFSTAPPKPWQG
jgi:hypothetical protein